MSRYSLELSKSSIKFLDKSDRVTRERIINLIHALSENPYSFPGIIKLAGYEYTYRVRIGKYRVIYQVLNEILLIFIQDIDSRGDVYKQL
jgi:mRNA interferase RelE/StbE